MGEFTKTYKELQNRQNDSDSAFSGLNLAQKNPSTGLGGIDARIGDIDSRMGHLTKDLAQIQKRQQEVGGQMGSLVE